MQITGKITIEQPIEKVWEVLIDPEQMKHWLSGLRKYEVISGLPGKQGYKSKHHYKENGKWMIMEEEVIESIVFEKLVSQLIHPELENLITHSLRSINDDTTALTFKISINPKSFLMKMAIPVLRKQLAERAKADYQTLKRILEKI